MTLHGRAIRRWEAGKGGKEKLPGKGSARGLLLLLLRASESIVARTPARLAAAASRTVTSASSQS